MKFSIDDLSYSYKETNALKHICFSLINGDFVTIVGPNGSGKSTLLKCMDRILRYKEGTITLNSEEIREIPVEILSHKVAYVPQKDEGMNSSTVFDAVMLGRKPHIKWQINDRDIRIVSDTLERFGLSELAMRNINTLSGGQRQRVLIARALCQQPDILLLDEPTANLDLFHQSEIMEHLTQLASDGLIIVVTVHDINLAVQYCNKAIMLDEGMLFACGGKDIFTKDNIDRLFKTTVRIVRQDDQIFIVPMRKHKIG